MEEHLNELTKNLKLKKQEKLLLKQKENIYRFYLILPANVEL